MLAQQRRMTPNRGRAVFQFQRGGGHSQVGNIGVGDIHEHVPGLNLFVVDHVGDPVDGPAGDSSPGDQLHPGCHRLGAEDLAQRVDTLGPVLNPVRVVGEPGIIQQVRPLNSVAQPLPQTIVGATQNELAVGGREALIWHQAGMPRPQPVGLHACADVAGGVVAHGGYLTVQQRRIDALAPACVSLVEQGRHYRPVGHHPGEKVHQREAYPQGPPIGLSGQVHQAAVGLDNQVVSGHVGHGSGAPVTGDGAIDNIRVDGGHGVVAQPHAVQGAGPETLHHHVGLGRQPQNDVNPFLLLQVEAQAALVAVEGQELGALAVPEGGPRAGLVPQVGLLDLDDFRAHVPHHHGAERSRQSTGQVNNFDAFQC